MSVPLPQPVYDLLGGERVAATLTLEGYGAAVLLVEESDGFDFKILVRYKARELQVPVIMEASDRCMVDVERFDLEPKRSILHGIVDHLDIAALKSLKTTEEKVRAYLQVPEVERLRWLEELCAFTSMVRQAPTTYRAGDTRPMPEAPDAKP